MKYERFFQLLETGKSRYPDAPALLFERDSLTYGELFDRVIARRNRFLKEPGAQLGMVAPASPEWVVILFGAVLAGKNVVLLDSSQPLETLKAAAVHTDLDTLFCEDEEYLAELTPLLKPCVMPSGGEEGKLLFFTSGTTASNKAVVLSSRALCYSAWNGQQMLPCERGDVILSILPLNHVFGFVCSLLWPLSRGAAVAIGRGMRCFATDPGFYQPTILPAVPSLTKYLLAMKAFNPALKTVLVGASPCDKATLEAIHAMGIQVRFGYGLTETASGLAISMTNDEPLAMALCPDTKLRLGEDGEIFVRTPCMMDGYYHNDAATAAVLTDGELATGDLGYLDEAGCLHLTGRKKDFLILENGNKVFCAEWEQQLSSLLGTETAVTIQNGKIWLTVVGPEADRERAMEKVQWFNATQPFDQRIFNVNMRTEPLPRTQTGKLKRWAI